MKRFNVNGSGELPSMTGAPTIAAAHEINPSSLAQKLCIRTREQIEQESIVRYQLSCDDYSLISHSRALSKSSLPLSSLLEDAAAVNETAAFNLVSFGHGTNMKDLSSSTVTGASN